MKLSNVQTRTDGGVDLEATDSNGTVWQASLSRHLSHPLEVATIVATNGVAWSCGSATKVCVARVPASARRAILASQVIALAIA